MYKFTGLKRGRYDVRRRVAVQETKWEEKKRDMRKRGWGDATGRDVKRRRSALVRSFAAAGAFIILSVSSSENPAPRDPPTTALSSLFTRAFLVFNFPAQPSGHFESS
jgi:hypothetical protein